MAHTASDGKHFPSRTQKGLHENRLKSSMSQDKSDPLAAPSGEGDNQDTGNESPEEVVAQHGPAHEVHVTHAEGHHVHSMHPDGHESHSDHGSVEEAHEHGKALATEPQQEEMPEEGGEEGY